MALIFVDSTHFLRMIGRNLAWVVLVYACLAVLGFAIAQNVNSSIEGQELPYGLTSTHVDSNLVLIPVTVVDHDGRFITGLDRERFRLYDDKVEQTITHFAMEDAPVSVAVVFDASASMGRKILQAHEAVSAFLNTANPDDELLLVQFSDQANLLLGLTKTVEEVRERMMYLRPPEEQRY